MWWALLPSCGSSRLGSGEAGGVIELLCPRRGKGGVWGRPGGLSGPPAGRADSAQRKNVTCGSTRAINLENVKCKIYRFYEIVRNLIEREYTP